MAVIGSGGAAGGALFPVTKTWQTNELFTTGADYPFTSVVVRATETNFEGKDRFRYFASADGKTNWEEVSNRTRHTFTNTGTSAYVKGELIGTGGANTYLESLEVSFFIDTFRLGFGTFNGTDNYITVADDSSLDITGAISISLAVYVPTLPGAEEYLLNKWDGTDGYAVRINSSDEVELIYSNGGSDTVFNTGTALVAKTWQHVVFTKSASTALTAYVNGSSVNTATGGSTIGTNNNALEVGRQSTNYFPGSLDEVRVYNDLLTSGEVSNLFNKIEHLSNNVLYWSMDNPKLSDQTTTKEKNV